MKKVYTKIVLSIFSAIVFSQAQSAGYDKKADLTRGGGQSSATEKEKNCQAQAKARGLRREERRQFIASCMGK